jgi:hypothetical protein
MLSQSFQMPFPPCLMKQCYMTSKAINEFCGSHINFATGTIQAWVDMTAAPPYLPNMYNKTITDSFRLNLIKPFQGAINPTEVTFYDFTYYDKNGAVLTLNSASAYKNAVRGIFSFTITIVNVTQAALQQYSAMINDALYAKAIGSFYMSPQVSSGTNEATFYAADPIEATATAPPSAHPSAEPSVAPVSDVSSSPSAEPSNLPTGTAPPSAHPSAEPSVAPVSDVSSSPSAEPSNMPTLVTNFSLQPSHSPMTDIALEDNSFFLSIKLRNYSQRDLVVVFAFFACVSGLLLWLGCSRHAEVLRCNRDLGDNKSKSNELSQDLLDFKASSYMKSLFSFLSMASSLSQMSELVTDGYVWNAYSIVGSYLINLLISLVIQFDLFQILCFARFSDLPLRLHRKALSRKQLLWSLVALLSLYDLSYLRFFPWINNEFCQRSEGFPTLTLFVVVNAASLLHNAIITAAMSAKLSLNLLQFLSLLSSAFLIVLSLYSLCIKVLYEKISLHQVVVVSKEFAKRANAAGISLRNAMIVEIDLESWSYLNEVPPTDLETAADEQRRISATLDDLLQRQSSRCSTETPLISTISKSEVLSDEFQKSIASENPHADKTIEILKQQLINDYGGRPLEYIPLPLIKAELDQLMQAARDGASFDENRLDHLIRCMEYNEEYIAQKREEERQWVESTRDFLTRSLEAMRPFVPVGIASMTQQDLEGAGLSKALAKRIMTKRCLWLIRMSQSDIAKMHVADLTGKYSPEAQNLDVIEMAAIYEWLLGVTFESDTVGKKRKVREALKQSLKEKMGIVASFDELVNKRNATYKNQTGPFTDLGAVFSQEVVSSEDAFSPRMSRLSFRGLSRPAFDTAARTIFESKFRSDETGDEANENKA